MVPLRRCLLASIVLASVLVAVPPRARAAGGTFLGGFNTVTTIASTVPANGDVNPYGVAVVPATIGKLTKGNVLVSNFNAVSNLQGTGTTIVQVAPNGTVSQFAQISGTLPGACPGGVGLTTALSVLSTGWVIVGSLPTTDGTAATAKAGCLLVLNSMGQVVETIANAGINGPWDMTALDLGKVAFLFVTNVLNGTVAANGAVVNAGTVLRLTLFIPSGKMPLLIGETLIGSGFAQRTDPAALVIGPTGVGLGAGGTLYVADSLQNRIAAIPQAITRTVTAYSGLDVTANGALNDPLGLAIAPNGDIITTNGNDGNAVETTPSGTQVATATLDSATGAGTLFGLAPVPDGSGLYFVDDGTNTLNEFTTPHATIQNFAFSPSSLTIKVGQTVTWTNKDAVPHTVTADDSSFNSGPIAPGASYTHTFTTAGTVMYHCAIHAFMAHAAVVVTS